MDNQLSKKANDWREGRRLRRAWELKQEGWKQSSTREIAEASLGGVSKGAAVSHSG